MRILNSRAAWGWALIAGGIIFLLQNLNVLPDIGWIWAAAFGMAGLIFLFYFFRDSERWWSAFPAFGLLGIAGTLLFADLLPGDLADEIGGAFFIGMLGLSFLFIYLRTRDHWWPIIPAGSLLTIGGIILVTSSSIDPGPSVIGLVLFGGLALTFLVLFLVPSESGRAKWAIWPAASMLVPAFIFGVGAFGLANYLLPAVLILAGGFILVRSFR